MHAAYALFPRMHIPFKTCAAQKPQEFACQIPTETLSLTYYTFSGKFNIPFNSTLRKKIKYFVLEPSIFGVKTSPSMENTERENKILLSSTNFQDPKY